MPQAEWLAHGSGTCWTTMGLPGYRIDAQADGFQLVYCWCEETNTRHCTRTAEEAADIDRRLMPLGYGPCEREWVEADGALHNKTLGTYPTLEEAKQHAGEQHA